LRVDVVCCQAETVQSIAVLAEGLTQTQADCSAAIARNALPCTKAKDCRSTFAPSSK